MKSRTTLLIVGLIILVLITSIAIFSTSEKTNEPKVGDISYEKTGILNESVDIVSYNYGTLTVRGSLTKGSLIKVDQIKRNKNTVYVDIIEKSPDNDDVRITPELGTSYYIELYNINKNDTVKLDLKSNKKKKLDISSYNQKNVDVTINRVKSNNATDGTLNYRITNNSIEVFGQITANTGGHSLDINRVEVENNTLRIDPDLIPPSGVAPQAITTYEYKITVKDKDRFSKISVYNNGKLIEKDIDTIN